jgi:hypothetical protein
MKNNLKRIILSIFILGIILSIFPTSTYAASGSASVSAPSTVKPGDTVTVTFTFKASKIEGVDANFSYDKSVLKYNGGSNTSDGKIVVYGDGNSSSLSAKASFVAQKEGSSTIKVSTVDFYANMEPVNNVSASTKVTVKKPTQSKPSSSNNSSSSSSSSSSNTNTSTKPDDKKEPEKVPEKEEEEKVNPVEEAVKISLEEKELFIWKDLSTIKIPDGFKSSNATYKTEKIKVAKAEDKDITLAYLTDKDGKNGSFYILDKEENLYPYINLNSESKYTVILLDSSTKLPEGYKETEIELDGKTIQAWTHEENPEFYLLYVMNTEGEKDFYLYDQAEKTMQRYTDRTVVVEVEKEPEPMTFFEKLSNDPTLLAIVGTLAALSIILLGVLIVLYRKLGRQGRH